MAKIIENTTASDIEIQDLGITVKANGIYDLSFKWSVHIEQSDDLEAVINSGDIKLIKVENPRSYYNPVQAIRILKSDIDIVLAGGETTEVLSTENGNLDWVDIANAPNPALGALYAINFVEESSGISNSWLSYLGDGGMNSNEVPAIVPWKSRLVGATFSGKEDDVDVDLDVYSVDWIDSTSPKNLMWQWQLRGVRAGRVTDFPTPVIFEAGDKISVYCADRGGNPKKVVFTLYLKVIEENTVNLTTTWSGNVATTGAGTD